MGEMKDRVLFTLDSDNKVTSPAYDERIENLEKDDRRFWGILSCMKDRIDSLEERLDVQERMIEICMELIHEQKDTIQLIKYAFED